MNTKKKPPGKHRRIGKYSARLAEIIKKNHAHLLNEKNEKREFDQVSRDELSEHTRIDKSNFNKIINNQKELSEKELFRLISMPWVTPEAAQRWILLWIANQLDKYQLDKEYNVNVPLFEDAKSRGWTPNQNLKRLSNSLATLADYVPTLGVINQINYARQRKNESIKLDSYHLPVEGPRINGRDLNNPAYAKTQEYWRNSPLTALALKFANELADLEAEERVGEINGYLNEELSQELSDVEDGMDALLECLGSEKADVLLEHLSEDDVETLLMYLGGDTAEHVNAAEITSKIITFMSGKHTKAS